MSLWFVLALMTAAAVFAVLWPLGRMPRRASGDEAMIYKDQLAEIARDRSAGLIAADDADAARLEISRRLLSAADAAPSLPQTSHLTLRRAVAASALIGVPLLAGALYLKHGSPMLGDFPLAARATADSTGVALFSKGGPARVHRLEAWQMMPSNAF